MAQRLGVVLPPLAGEPAEAVEPTLLAPKAIDPRMDGAQEHLGAGPAEEKPQ